MLKKNKNDLKIEEIERGNCEVDPVCGMIVEENDKKKECEHNNEIFFFCGDKCLERFKQDPQKFSGEPLIRLEDIKKNFKIGNSEVQILRGLNMRIWRGDFVAIVGASGSGKSTSLNMIGLLDRPSSGKIFIEGKEISESGDEQRAKLRSAFFGFVFQQYNLIPWLTALENVASPLIFTGKKIDYEKLIFGFKEIGLNERMHHKPFELSGGEQQRVALIRALANDPEIILGDEPTGNLDSLTGKKILNMLIDLNKKKGKTLIIVTHDVEIAKMADQIISIKDGKVLDNHDMNNKIYMS